jgi:hypothetical protein
MTKRTPKDVRTFLEKLYADDINLWRLYRDEKPFGWRPYRDKKPFEVKVTAEGWSITADYMYDYIPLDYKHFKAIDEFFGTDVIIETDRDWSDGCWWTLKVRDK